MNTNTFNIGLLTGYNWILGDTEDVLIWQFDNCICPEFCVFIILYIP
jgi:hypothetical protein